MRESQSTYRLIGFLPTSGSRYPPMRPRFRRLRTRQGHKRCINRRQSKCAHRSFPRSRISGPQHHRFTPSPFIYGKRCLRRKEFRKRRAGEKGQELPWVQLTPVNCTIEGARKMEERVNTAPRCERVPWRWRRHWPRQNLAPNTILRRL